MEKIQLQNLKTLNQFPKFQILKKITQLLLSVSVFSLLFSNAWVPSFLHSLNFYFSTLPLRLFTHNLDKNCIFLLCNGLLVLVAKYSGLLSSTSQNSRNSAIDDQCLDYYEHDIPPSSVLEPKMAAVENEVLGAIEENAVVEENDHHKLIINGRGDQDEETNSEGEFVVEEDQDDDGDGEEGDESGFLSIGGESTMSIVVSVDDRVSTELNKELDRTQKDEHYDDEEDDAGNGVMNMEELNKKFEEFIRRMKEEIRIEAQQQLVMVN